MVQKRQANVRNEYRTIPNLTQRFISLTIASRFALFQCMEAELTALNACTPQLTLQPKH
jgi:hypothetical protein